MINKRKMWRLSVSLLVLIVGFPAQAETKIDKTGSKLQSSTSLPQSVGSKVYKKNVESIVLIDAEDAKGRRQGSGVAFRNGLVIDNGTNKFTAKSTWIVTNAHVVNDAKFVRVLVAGFPVNGEVAFRYVKMDIAFIFLDDTVIKPIELNNNSSKLSPGDEVFAIGAPQGLTRSISAGIVSANRTIDGVRLIQTSAAISPGSSGGGLFNQLGELAGITTFKIVGGDSLNFAVEIKQVQEIFEVFGAADVIKFSFNQLYSQKNIQIFDEALVKWLYEVHGESGGSVYDEYMYSDLQYSKKEISPEKYYNKIYEIASRYYEFVNASKVQGNASAGGNNNASDSSLILICQVNSANGSTHTTKSFTIDFDKKNIDGYPAKIDSDFMGYTYSDSKGTVFVVVFDRNAGIVTISTEQFPNLLNGKCSKSEGKVF